MKKFNSVKKRTSRAFTSALITSSLMAGGIVVGLTSCDSGGSDSGSFTTGTGQGIVDDDFVPTVERFIEEAEKRNIAVNFDDLDIVYGDTNGALGVCSRTSNTRAITISTRLRNAPEDLLNEIILHELGHCVLFRGHSDNPESIMHATNIIGEPFREEVFDELFFF